MRRSLGDKLDWKIEEKIGKFKKEDEKRKNINENLIKKVDEGRNIEKILEKMVDDGEEEMMYLIGGEKIKRGEDGLLENMERIGMVEERRMKNDILMRKERKENDGMENIEIVLKMKIDREESKEWVKWDLSKCGMVKEELEEKMLGWKKNGLKGLRGIGFCYENDD